MIDLKILGELFYLGAALSTFYGAWSLFRGYRRINSTVIKTHITAYKLQKMVESRSR